MLKFYAFILMLPVCAGASDDCLMSFSENTTSIECADMVITKKNRQQKHEIRLEFADGFTLFFQSPQNQQPEEFVVALGDRNEAIISNLDQNNLKSALYLLAKTDDDNEPIVDFLQNLPSNQPLQEVIQFGGEVPWPIVGCKNKESKNADACKEKK